VAVASIAVPPDPRRDALARELATAAHTWPIITLKRAHGSFDAGTTFRRCPGSRGATYLVNTVACECPDYQRSQNICKHVRAMVIFEAGRQQPPATPTTIWKPCAGRCGELLAPAHLGRFCNACTAKNRRILDAMDVQDIG
jgi:hypothetical protein